MKMKVFSSGARIGCVAAIALCTGLFMFPSAMSVSAQEE